MNLLPVVQRELLVASRRRSTYFVRMWTAAVGALVGAGMLEQVGRELFTLLSYLTWGGVLLSGIFLTADALTFERREGTLGLLFLTDLRGFDVVLGKLATAGLSSFFGLISLFPVFAIGWLLGGVSRPEFWCTCLALLITLLFSLSVGLAVSSTRGTLASPALFRASCWLALFAVGLPTLAARAVSWPPLAPWVVVLQANPWDCIHYASNTDSPTGMTRFVRAAVGLLAWSVLAVAYASYKLPLSWKDAFSRKENGALLPTRSKSRFWRRPTVLSQPLLERSPIAALLDRSLKLKTVAWGVAIAAVLPAWLEWPFPGICQIGVGTPGTIMAFLLLGLLFLFLLVAWEATGFFSEASRSGWLEILLATPLPDREFLEGQWAAMRRVYLLPIATVFITMWQVALRYTEPDEQIACFFLALFQGVAVIHFITAALAGATCGLQVTRRPMAFLKTMGMLLFPQLALLYPVLEPLIMVALLFYLREGLAAGLRRRIDKTLFVLPVGSFHTRSANGLPKPQREVSSG